MEKNPEVEYETAVVGAAYLVKGIMMRLGLKQAIDDALEYQPLDDTTYGTLAQVLVVNRMGLQPQPLYRLKEWVIQHGMGQVLDIDPDWLDGDRSGAMLEGLADHQVTIWSAILRKAVQHFKIDLEWLHTDTTSNKCVFR